MPLLLLDCPGVTFTTLALHANFFDIALAASFSDTICGYKSKPRIVVIYLFFERCCLEMRILGGCLDLAVDVAAAVSADVADLIVLIAAVCLIRCFVDLCSSSSSASLSLEADSSTSS